MITDKQQKKLNLLGLDFSIKVSQFAEYEKKTLAAVKAGEKVDAAEYNKRVGKMMADYIAAGEEFTKIFGNHGYCATLSEGFFHEIVSDAEIFMDYTIQSLPALHNDAFEKLLRQQEKEKRCNDRDKDRKAIPD